MPVAFGLLSPTELLRPLRRSDLLDQPQVDTLRGFRGGESLLGYGDEPFNRPGFGLIDACPRLVGQLCDRSEALRAEFPANAD